MQQEKRNKDGTHQYQNDSGAVARIMARLGAIKWKDKIIQLHQLLKFCTISCHDIKGEETWEDYVQEMKKEMKKEEGKEEEDLHDQSKWELSDEEKITLATDIKEEGKKAFAQQCYQVAAQTYDDALTYLVDVDGEQARVLLGSLTLNQCIAQCKGQDNSAAVLSATVVLEGKETVAGYHAKALYWRAMAKFQMNEYVECKKDCLMAIKLNKVTNKSIVKLYNRTLKKIQERNARERAIYGDMFGNMSMYEDQPDVTEAEVEENTPKETTKGGDGKRTPRDERRGGGGGGGEEGR